MTSKVYEICYKGEIYKVRVARRGRLVFNPQHPNPTTENLWEIREIIRQRDVEDASKRLKQKHLHSH